MARAPHRLRDSTLVGLATRADTVPLSSWSHSGVEWSWGSMGAPSASWSAAEFILGRKAGPDPATAASWSWTGPTGAMFAELLGIRGEVLWSHMNNANTATTVSSTAPVLPLREAGLVFVAGAAIRSGSTVTAVHSAGLLPIAEIANSVTGGGRLLVYRYVPGTLPTVAWTFGSAANHGVIAAILR